MDIGSMRQRIILQKHILHTDEIGNHQSHWEKFYSCFAYVNLASGKENVTTSFVWMMCSLRIKN